MLTFKSFDCLSQLDSNDPSRAVIHDLLHSYITSAQDFGTTYVSDHDGYVVLIEWGGFTLTTFAFLASAMLLLAGGRKAHLILPLAAAIALIGYGLFMVAFETRFPRGPFEQLMSAVL